LPQVIQHTFKVHLYIIGNYETPLGEVKVNLEICNELIKSNKIFSFVPDAHKTEHSIEVQLPFLQYHLKNDFQIVPIVIGFDGAKNAKARSRSTKTILERKKIFL
jgi:AmmeMemoRadiSam system protein B